MRLDDLVKPIKVVLGGHWHWVQIIRYKSASPIDDGFYDAKTPCFLGLSEIRSKAFLLAAYSGPLMCPCPSPCCQLNPGMSIGSTPRNSLAAIRANFSDSCLCSSIPEHCTAPLCHLPFVGQQLLARINSLSKRFSIKSLPSSPARAAKCIYNGRRLMTVTALSCKSQHYPIRRSRTAVPRHAPLNIMVRPW